MRKSSKATRIIVKGDYIDNRGGYVIKNIEKFYGNLPEEKPQAGYSSPQLAVEPVKFIEESEELADETIKESIVLLMNMNTRRIQRWWFAVYRVLKDENKVFDLHGFKNYIDCLFENVPPIKVDTHDLGSKVEVGTFRKPFHEWDIQDSPVSSRSFEAYKSLVITFRSLLGIG